MKHRQIHLNRLERLLLLFSIQFGLDFGVITAKKLLENRFHVLRVWKCNIRTLLFKIERHLKTLYTFYEAINSFTNILARVLSIHVCTSTWVMAFVMRIAPTILDQNRLVSIQNGRQIEFKYCSNLSIVDHFTASMLLAFVPSHETILLLFMFPIIFCSIFSLFNANINI